MKSLYISLIICLAINMLNAQGVSISETITEPHSSAILDLQSDSKGFLPTRLTTSQRDAIQQPAVGLTIYNTSVKCLEFFNGTTWVSLCNSEQPEFQCGISKIQDVDGNEYATAQIGTQCWMAENLKTTAYKNNTPIPYISVIATWESQTTGAYTWYNFDEATNGNLYGALYNWFAVNTGNLCPDGWRIPLNNDWDNLVNFVGTNPGTKLKSTSGWSSGNGTDDFGFKALPSGRLYYDGINTTSFNQIGSVGYWWVSEQANIDLGNGKWIHSGATVNSNNPHKRLGNSVRCIKE
jgi:uncharacterized protein (TIGR02145 family)